MGIMTRLLLLILAAGMLPFAMTSHNGATLLGGGAVIAFIVLTIVGAPGSDSLGARKGARHEHVG